MKHVALALVAWLGLGACGEDGEPMKGNVTVNYGSSKPGMKFGTAVAATDSTTKMLVQFGSGGVDCDTYLDVFLDFSLPDGTFIYFVVDRTPGSLVEEKEYSLVWHYRMADPESGEWLANELASVLEGLLAETDLRAVRGRLRVRYPVSWFRQRRAAQQ